MTLKRVVGFLYSLRSLIWKAKESLGGACMAVKAALSLLPMRTPNQLHVYTHQSRPRMRHDLPLLALVLVVLVVVVVVEAVVAATSPAYLHSGQQLQYGDW